MHRPLVGGAIGASSSSRLALLVLVLASLACAPVSWIMDGVTPSFVVYPLLLLFGLWRYQRGGGALFFGVVATVFLVIHLPFAWAAITNRGENPPAQSEKFLPVVAPDNFSPHSA